VAGKKITVGRASVSFGDELDRAVDRLVRDVYGDVVDIVEGIAAEISTYAKREWYNNVTQRTGRSGRGNDYRMQLVGDKVEGVVFNDAKKGQKDPKTQGMAIRRFTDVSYAYYVHRPGPFSTQLTRLNDEEYRELMSYWKRNGTIPEGMVAERMTDALGRKRPVGVSKTAANPDRWDGKNLWKLLVLDPSKQAIKDALPKLNRAMDESGKRFSRGV